jgi:hypothetical protein
MPRIAPVLVLLLAVAGCGGGGGGQPDRLSLTTPRSSATPREESPARGRLGGTGPVTAR